VHNEISNEFGEKLWSFAEDVTGGDRHVLRRSFHEGVSLENAKMVVSVGTSDPLSPQERIVVDTVTLNLRDPLDETDPKWRSCEVCVTSSSRTRR
jgi:hypothetical protein